MTKNPSEELAKTYQKELREIQKKSSKIDINPDAGEDYEFSRQFLHRLISKSEEALDTLLALTQDSEHPRAYEVLAGLLKTAGDLSDQLMKLQKTRHQLDHLNNPEKKNGNTTTNNNVFIGSTTDLQKFLQNEKLIDKEDYIDVE